MGNHIGEPFGILSLTTMHKWQSVKPPSLLLNHYPGAKIATNTSGAVASSFGAELIDPIVGIGLIVWDLWDYQHTVNIERPILRDAIFNYSQEVKYDLVNNHQGSVLSSIYQIETSVNQSWVRT